MRPEDLRNHFGDLYFCGTRTTWFWSTLCFLILSSSTLGCQNFFMLLTQMGLGTSDLLPLGIRGQVDSMHQQEPCTEPDWD